MTISYQEHPPLRYGPLMPQCDMRDDDGSLRCPGSPDNVVDEMHKSYNHMLMQVDQRLQYLPKLTPPKRVSFAEDALLYSSDVTPEEALSGWYTADDYQGFKKGRKDAIRMIKKNGFNIDNIEAEGYCLRGFEPYFSLEINRGIKHARETALRNVLREQQRQMQLGLVDDEAMRTRYAQATQWIRTNAIQLGTNDAAMVREMRYEELRQRQQQLGGPRSVTKSKRNEFVQTAALHRERSTRQLRVEEEDDLDTRHMTGIMKKLESAFQLVGKIDLSGDIDR
jgi:hypothetical protein